MGVGKKVAATWAESRAAGMTVGTGAVSLEVGWEEAMPAEAVEQRARSTEG